jgi:hypothetical protein
MTWKQAGSDDFERKADRVPIDADARLRPNDWSSLEIHMIDLSPLGFRGRCDARLPAGSGVSLDVPGIGAVGAQVEWQHKDEFGARFFAPIALESCEWTLADGRHALATLLVQRAAARRAARNVAEIRPRILMVPAMRKGFVA